MTAYLPYVAKNAVLALPLARKLYRNRQVRRGYDPGKDDAAYALGVFEKHAAVLGDCIDKDVLELGPGGNLGVALCFLLHGARSATAVDLVPYAGSPLTALYEDIAAKAGFPGEGRRVAEVRYLAPLDIERSTLPSNAFDILYSHACFEHFQNPQRVIDEIGRLLRVGGRTSHQIDLADHRDKSTPLDFLRFSDWTWSLATSSGGNWSTNRWRTTDFRRAFVESFDITHWIVTDRCEIPHNAKLAPRFRSLPEEELSAIGLLLGARLNR